MSDGKENSLCTACLEANPQGEHFCQKCGAPLSSYATTAPLEQIYSLGWMYRRALSQPVRPIVLLGIWLIIGPTFLWSIWHIVWSDERFWLNIIIAVFWAGLSGMILYRITKNFIVEIRQNHRMHQNWN
jgi:hypothetical protein